MLCARKVYALLIAASIIRSIRSATAGMRITVTEETLKMINQAQISSLQKDLIGKRFDDVSDSSGSLEWTISDIRLQYLGTMTPTVSLQNTGQITWGCFISLVTVVADWRAKLSGWIPISASGSIEAKVFRSSITIALTLSENFGRLGINLSTCSASVGSVELDFSGNLLDGFLNSVSNIFEDDLKRELQRSICDAVSTGMKNIAEDMKNLTMSLPIKVIGIPLTLDNALTQISVSSDAITTYHRGAINWIDHTFYTSDTSPFPVARTSDGIAFDLKEDVFNNLIHTYIKSGKLNGFIDYQRVVNNGWDEFYLTCSDGSSRVCFGSILQQVATEYPDRVLGIQWSVQSAFLNIQTDQVTGKLSGRVNCSADSNQHSFPLFSAVVELEIAFQLKFSRGSISARASTWGGHATIDRSNIGKVLTPSIVEATNLFILPGLEKAILDIINDFKTHYAIELPKNVFIKESNVRLYEGVIRIEGDLCYNTTTCLLIPNDVWVGRTDIPKFKVDDVITTSTTTSSTTTTPTITIKNTTTTTTVSPSAQADRRVKSGQPKLAFSVLDSFFCLIIIVHI